MKNFFLAVFCSAGTVISFAQPASLNELGCATVTSPAEIQRIYDFVSKPYTTAKVTGLVDSIPLSIHLVGNDNGIGHYKLDDLFTVICQLNTRYAPVNLYFYIKWPLHYINNSTYYEHNYFSGSQMMAQNNVANTVNVYFVEDPSGACGYYTYGQDAVAIKKSCSAPNSTTLVHELGHYFSLPHTFYGWENGNTPANPEKVTRGVGANCSTAGDGFCDTEADWKSDRWYCPYTGFKLDPVGVPYHPDSSIYMGYAVDACMSRFSNQQIAAINYDLDVYRQNLLTGTHLPYSALSMPELVYPAGTVYANHKKAIWKKVPGAEYYHVKITHPATAAFVYQEAVVSDTFINITANLNVNAAYAVRVAPLNNSNVCRNFSLVSNFTYSGEHTNLSISSAAGNDGVLKIAPNPVTNGIMNIYFQSLPAGDYKVQLINLSGQKMAEQLYQSLSGSGDLSMPVGHLPAGMYFLHMECNGGRWVEKIMIQQ